LFALQRTASLKNVGGAASSIIALVDYKYPLLPVNPKIRGTLTLVSAIFALLVGIGCHQTAKALRKLWVGWLSISPALAVLGAIFWLASDPSSLSPQAVSLLVKIAYVMFFSLRGGAVGGFFQ